MKGKLIISSFFAAIAGMVFCASGIEGGAPLLPCTMGMIACLIWMLIVEYANR